MSYYGNDPTLRPRFRYYDVTLTWWTDDEEFVERGSYYAMSEDQACEFATNETNFGAEPVVWLNIVATAL